MKKFCAKNLISIVVLVLFILMSSIFATAAGEFEVMPDNIFDTGEDTSGDETADETIVDNSWTFSYEVNSDGKTVTITGCTDGGTTLTIPAIIDGYAVTTVGKTWRICDISANITKLIISEGIETIGKKAFANIDKLVEIKLPASLTNIGSEAFSGSDGIKSIVIPDNVKSIGTEAFRACLGLTSVTVGAETIGTGAFWQCSALTDLTIMNGVKSIEDSAFSSCDKITCLSLPDSIIKIGSSAFGSYIYDVTIPKSVKEIGTCPFSFAANIYVHEENQFFCAVDSVLFDKNMTLLIQAPKSITQYTVPNTVITIGDSAFFYCRSLKNVALADSITHIGDYAFYLCEKLANYHLPKNLTTVGDFAFYGTQIEKIIIPNNLQTIGQSMFQCCKKLKYVEFEDDGKLEEINMSTFCDCTSLRSIEIPASVTYLNNYVFDGCTALESVIFDKNCNIPKLGIDIFRNCDSLVRVDLPNGLTSVSYEMFRNCDNLERVIIPSTVTKIGEHAFFDCDNLKSIILDKNITNIVDSIVYNYTSTILTNCKNLETIYLYRGSYSEEYCFKHKELIPYIVYLDDLETNDLDFTLSDDRTYYIVTGIGDCTDTYIEIPEEHNGLPVKAIGEGAFFGNTTIEKIIIPKTVERIGAKAFFECTAIVSVLFDDESNLVFIGDSAFEGCISLVSFEAPFRVIHIGRRAFARCISLRRIILRELLEWIGEELFYDCSSLSNNIYTLEDSYADNYCRNNSHSRRHYKKLHSGNISILGDSDTEIPNDFELTAEEVDENDIRKKHGDCFGNEDRVKGHDISLHVDGQKLQPNDSVTVEIDVPEDFNGEKCDVYRREKDGTLTKMDVDHHGGKLRFETDHFSTYIVVEDIPTSDFLSFDGFQVRKDDYNGLRSRFTADFTKMAELEAKGYEVIEFGTVLASANRLNENGDTLTVSKNESGIYGTVSYGRIIPVWQNDIVVNKYITNTADTLTFACTVTNYTVNNFDLEVYVRGYAVIKDELANEYITYSDYPLESYRSLSLKRICEELAAAGRITAETNISYADVIAFIKEREDSISE